MKKNNGSKLSSGGLKEIREIIFGEALSNLQKQVDELKNENKELRQQLESEGNEILKSANSINKIFDKLSESDSNHKKLSKDLDEFVASLKVEMKALKLAKIDKNQIGQAFIEWGTKVKEDPST